jgi:hypothetical protein
MILILADHYDHTWLATTLQLAVSVTWLFRLYAFASENNYFNYVNMMAEAACRGLKGVDEAIKELHVPEVQERTCMISTLIVLLANEGHFSVGVSMSIGGRRPMDLEFTNFWSAFSTMHCLPST